MKEIIEFVNEWGMVLGGGFVGLLALPYILWRMVLAAPKFLVNVSKAATILVLGGGALLAGLKFAEWGYDNEERVKEVGPKKFWEETIPKAPWVEDKDVD